jgi:hypothetical protein
LIYIYYCEKKPYIRIFSEEEKRNSENNDLAVKIIDGNFKCLYYYFILIFGVNIILDADPPIIPLSSEEVEEMEEKERQLKKEKKLKEKLEQKVAKEKQKKILEKNIELVAPPPVPSSKTLTQSAPSPFSTSSFFLSSFFFIVYIVVKKYRY